ncbi:cbb3-type cytochrome oxidase subunit 3 [Paraburkholderia sp. GAS41]|jgi:cbb3-type cytochrome oxidase subunit 3|uniref:DUF4381 domain-containing protein n=1 Tax=Paraburkholderia sp. GAS41 TaxID=3035134 RepID=UPI003D21B03E
MKADAPAMLVPADTPGVLQPLQELPLSAPVSWAPQTVGWWAVAAVLFAALAGCVWAAWRHHRKQRYRRAALAQLQQIEAALKNPQERVAALAAIAPLIKRTALAVVPRERVASLGGEEWLTFLADTRGHFDERSGALLSLVSYAPAEQIAAVSEHEAQRLVSVTRDWIAHHHVEI